MNPGSFTVGAAVEMVPVPPGTPLAGFAARASASTGTLDPLTVRALALSDTCIVTVDVCGLHEDSCARIRTAVGGPGDVVVAATHTHAGPCVMPGRLGGCVDAVLAAIEFAAVRAVARARAGQRLAVARFTSVDGLGVARNRRHPERSVDPSLSAVVFSSVDDNEEIAWLLSYPCHPVVLDGANTLISADYVGGVRDAVEAASPGAVAVFCTGAAGDLNTGHSPESSYAPGSDPRRSPAEASRIGALLGAAALAARDGRILDTDGVIGRLATAAVCVDLEVLDAETPSELAARWRSELATAEPSRRALLGHWIEWAESPGAGESQTWSGRVSALELGGLTLVALPGEPFLESAAEIARAVPGDVLVLGYSDGCPGYFPTEDEYPVGGYEVIDAHRYYGMPAPMARGSAERLVAAAVDAVAEARRP